MTRVTTYTCDECRKPVSEVYGAITLTVDGEKEPLHWKADFCGTDCLKLWVGKQCDSGRRTT